MTRRLTSSDAPEGAEDDLLLVRTILNQQVIVLAAIVRRAGAEIRVSAAELHEVDHHSILIAVDTETNEVVVQLLAPDPRRVSGRIYPPGVPARRARAN